MVPLFVHAETAQSVRVGEFTEALKLLEAGWRVEFVSDFEKCHAEIIPAPAVNAAETKITDIVQSTAFWKSINYRDHSAALFAARGICFLCASENSCRLTTNSPWGYKYPRGVRSEERRVGKECRSRW